MPQPSLPATKADPKLQRRLDKAFTLAVLILPGLILYTLFLIVPIVQSAYYSLYDWNGLGPLQEFVGLNNYRRILSHTIFIRAISHNLVIIILSLIIQLPMALGLAILLGRGKLKGARLFRGLFFIPFVFSEVITAIIFLYVFHPNGGLVNILLSSFIPNYNISWLTNQNTVLLMIFLVITWKYFGYHMILYLAALQGVSPILEEAAVIDGANEAQVLQYIVIPLIAPTIRLSVFLSILGSLQQFILIWTLTQGGPANSSDVIVTYLYKYAIQRQSLGYGSAIAVILFFLTLTFSLGYQRTIMRQDFE